MSRAGEILSATGFAGDRVLLEENVSKKADASPSQGPRRNPTIKQSKFAIAYADPKGACGNGVAAARAAGYKGDNRQLAVQAHANLQLPNVQHMIAAMLDSMAEHALHRLGEALDSTKTRSMLSKDGEIVCTAPEPDHRTRLGAVEFFFNLRSKCTAVASAEITPLNQAGEGPTREEAIEAAKECLAVLAPHLLADTTRHVEEHEDRPEAAVVEDQDESPEAGSDGGQK